MKEGRKNWTENFSPIEATYAVCRYRVNFGALTFSPPAFGPSGNLTRTFRSMDTGSQKRLVLVADIPKWTNCSSTPKLFIRSQEKLDQLFVHITWSHCNYGQPNLVTFSPK
jgi:hypothetical protein